MEIIFIYIYFLLKIRNQKIFITECKATKYRGFHLFKIDRMIGFTDVIHGVKNCSTHLSERSYF